MRFNLHPFYPSRSSIGASPDSNNAASRFDVVTAVDDVIHPWRVGRNREGAMPEFTVKVFRVVALDPLAGAIALINGSPRRHEGGERTHILNRCAPTASSGGNTRHALFIN